MEKIKNICHKAKKRILKAILYFIAIIYARPKKVGENNIPKDGNCIICANHTHALDAPVLVLSLKREVIFIGKEELFENKFLNWLGNSFDVIAIKRDSADMEAMKKSFKALKQGKVLGLFPEGTRNGMAKGVKVHNGAALIALKTNSPIIPIGIQGNFKPFRQIKLNIGKPMDFSEYAKEKNNKEVLEKITNQVMEEVVRLTNEKI